MMYKKEKTIILLSFILILAITIIGCANDKTNAPIQTEVSKQTVIDMMKSDKNILRVDEQIENNTTTLTITVSNALLKDDALKLISVYSNLAKQEYQSKYLNIKIIQNGNIIGGVSVSK